MLNFLFLYVALIKHFFSLGNSIFCLGFLVSLFISTKEVNKYTDITEFLIKHLD